MTAKKPKKAAASKDITRPMPRITIQERIWMQQGKLSVFEAELANLQVAQEALGRLRVSIERRVQTIKSTITLFEKDLKAENERLKTKPTK